MKILLVILLFFVCPFHLMVLNLLGSKIIPVSVAMEQKIFPMSPEDRENFLTENKTKSKLAQIIQAGFESIHLVNFFTCGADEVRGTIHNFS